MELSLKDRKFIHNSNLPGYELGNESRTDYYNDLMSGGNIVSQQIQNSNLRTITLHQALKLVNNSTTSSWDKSIASMTPAQSSFVSSLQQWLPNDITTYSYLQPLDASKIPLNAENAVKKISLPKDIKPILFETVKTPTNADLQIKNATPETPPAKGQGLAKAGRIAGTAMGIAQGAMGLWQMGNQISEASKARINPEEMLMKYGTSNTNIGNGFSYERQNNIDTSSEMDQVKAETNQATMGMAMTGMSTGAAIGSILGPVGGAVGGAIGGIAGAIGGLFGGASRRRKEQERLRRANILANAVTNENRDNAFTLKIQKQVANKYGNQEDQLLYASRGAEYVMPDGLTSNNHNTQTAFGDINAPANALTQAGEKVVHKENGKYYVHKVTGSKNDSNYTFLFPNDSVITKKNAPYVEQAIQEGWYDKLLQKQALDREMKHSRNKISKYSLPGFARGAEWLGNAIPALTGFGIGLLQYNQAANLDVYKPNSFKQNQYIGALNDLDKLHIDYLPIANEQRAAEARVNRAIDYSGGLSTGQRATNRIASNLNTLNAIANGLMNWQKWNNELRSAAAKSRLEVGAQEAQRKLQAMQWDADTYAKGHAARQQGMQMGLYNMLNALEQYTANEFKRNQFNRTMDLYEQENQRKWEELWNKMGKGSSSPVMVGEPTNAYQEQDRLNSALSTALSEGRLKGTVLDPIVKVDPLPKIPATMDEDFGIMDKLHPLKLGAKGDRVKTLQDRLNLLNKNNKTWTPLNSGIYDKATKNAVRQFQMSQFKGKKNSKQWDGIYGINTRNALMRALAPFNIGGI